MLAGRLARPLAETAAAARRLAAGERGVPVPTSTTSEVAEVATALGGLDAALASSEGRQREFLRSVSHELRTPLTTIQGYAEGLADGVVGPDEAAAVGRTLLGEAQRMERYVADLLALSRLEADDFSLHLEVVDLADARRDRRHDLAGPGRPGGRRSRRQHRSVLGAHRRGPAPPGPRRARRQRSAGLLGR